MKCSRLRLHADRHSELELTHSSFMQHIFFDDIISILSISRKNFIFSHYFSFEISFSIVFFIFNSLIKTSCLWVNRVFVSSSIMIVVMKIHAKSIRSLIVFCRNQCLWISTWRNLMMKLSEIRVLIVCWLSHWIWRLWLRRKLMISKNLIHQINFLSASETTNNSISIELVMIVHCLKVFQSINSLNNLKA